VDFIDNRPISERNVAVATMGEIGLVGAEDWVNQVALVVHEVILNAVVVLTGVTPGIGVTVVKGHAPNGQLGAGRAVHIRLKRVGNDSHAGTA
jgi:hypothetical protein